MIENELDKYKLLVTNLQNWDLIFEFGSGIDFAPAWPRHVPGSCSGATPIRVLKHRYQCWVCLKATNFLHLKFFR